MPQTVSLFTNGEFVFPFQFLTFTIKFSMNSNMQIMPGWSCVSISLNFPASLESLTSPEQV